LNVSHSDLPGNIFDFRTCEAVLDGNRDFGLFWVKLATLEPPMCQIGVAHTIAACRPIVVAAIGLTTSSSAGTNARVYHRAGISWNTP